MFLFRFCNLYKTSISETYYMKHRSLAVIVKKNENVKSFKVGTQQKSIRIKFDIKSTRILRMSTISGNGVTTVVVHQVTQV